MAKKPKISAEDFESWRGNAITQTVMARFSEMIDDINEFWVAQLNGATPSDPLLLAFLQVELRAKREIIEDLRNIQLDDIIEEEHADSRDSRIGQIAAKAAAQAKGRAH